MDCAGEQEDVLLHNPDLLAQRIQLHVTDVYSVDGDAAAGDVIEAGQQAADCGFARAGRADKSNRIPGVDLQADLLQYRTIVVIAEADVSEDNISAQRTDFHRTRLIGDIRLCINHLKITLEPGNTFRIALDNGIDFLNRPEKDIGQQDESNKLPDLQLSLNKEPGRRP